MFNKRKQRAKRKRLPEVIISFTSRPGRIKTIQTMIDSLESQTFPADRILMWLDKDEFETLSDEDRGILDRITACGVEIRWITGGLKSHNKYFWVMQEYPDALIITIDDDLIFRPQMVDELTDSYERFPNAISSLRGHKVLLDENGEIAPYNNWVSEQREIVDTPSHRLFSNDGAGAIYPPHIFHEELFDRDALIALCKFNDDIWLNVHQILWDIPVVITGATSRLDYIDGTQEDSLWAENRFRNDSILHAAFEKFPQAHEKLVAAIKADDSQGL